MDPVTFPPRKVFHQFLLVCAFKVKAADIGSRWGFIFTNTNEFVAFRNFFPNRMLIVKRIAALVDKTELNGLAQCYCAGIGLVLTANHAE